MFAAAHGGVLDVRARFAFEAQCFVKIESDHRIARELQHEVAQRADGDSFCHLLPVGRSSVRMPGNHFRQSGFDELIEQIVRLDA